VRSRRSRSWRTCGVQRPCVRGTPPNKGMKLTKLSGAWLFEWTCRLMPAPPGSDAGTASQLIRGVLRTLAMRREPRPGRLVSKGEQHG
jgi:hypothetical protein